MVLNVEQTHSLSHIHIQTNKSDKTSKIALNTSICLCFCSSQMYHCVQNLYRKIIMIYLLFNCVFYSLCLQ